jgi:hypothetical protein
MSIFEKHHSRIACATSDNKSILEKALWNNAETNQSASALIATDIKGLRCSTLNWKCKALPVFSSMSLKVGPQEAGAYSIEE